MVGPYRQASIAPCRRRRIASPARSDYSLPPMSQPPLPTTPHKKRPHWWGPLRLIWQHRKFVVPGIACLLVTNLLAQAIPLAIKAAIESLTRLSNGAADPRGVYWAAFTVAGLAAGQALFRTLSRVLVFHSGRHAEYGLRRSLFEHLCTLDPAFYRTVHTGDLMSRLTNDLGSVRALLGAGSLYTTNTLFAYAIALPLMLGIDVQLTFLALAPYPVLFLGARWFAHGIYSRSEAQQRALAAMTSSVQEDLAGIREIKSYLIEARRSDILAERSANYLHHALRLALWRAGMLPFVATGVTTSIVLVLWIGAHRVVAGELSVGSLVAFNLYIGLLAWPTLAIGWMLSVWQRGLAAWQRLEAILDARPEIKGGTGQLRSNQGLGVELRGLSLAFEDKPVLRNISFRIEPGQLVAVVGRVGCGKSTLADVIARMEAVPAGTLLFDGQDVNTLTLDNARAQLSYAPQDAFLFSATLAENIALGIEDGVDETERNARIAAAANGAGLRDDLEALVEGLQTLVGERGITLSGGQRQRVALARALAAQRPLTILDDSLSAVDAETEADILSHLRTTLAGRTVLLVSHRLSALQHADHVIVLENGAIAEEGTHSALIAAGGLYAALYERQLLENNRHERASAGSAR